MFGETKPKPKQQPADVLEKRNETETAPELTPHETKRNRNEPISMPENRPFRFTHEFLVLLLTLPPSGKWNFDIKIDKVGAGIWCVL